MPRHGPPGDPHGLFGAARPAPSRGLFGSIGAGINEVLGGADDPRLTEEQNAEAARQARLQAGLAILLGSQSGPGMAAPGLAQALAQGVMVGQQAGGMARGGLVQQQQMQQAVQGSGLSPQQRAILASLPIEQQIEVLKELATAVTEPKVVGEGGALVDPVTGEVIYGAPGGMKLPTEMYPVIASLGKTPETMGPKDWATALQVYENLRRSGQTQINVDTGTIPPGWRAVRDDQGRVTEMEPIEGGPADLQIRDAERAREAAGDMTIRAARTVVQDVERSLDLVRENARASTGFIGGASRGIPGTPAHRLDQHIQSIKGNIGIDSLLRIKASGAGLGHIPQAQLEMLASLLGRLDTTMNVDDLIFNLERVQNIYMDIIRSTINSGGAGDLVLFGIDPSEIGAGGRDLGTPPWERK